MTPKNVLITGAGGSLSLPLDGDLAPALHPDVDGQPGLAMAITLRAMRPGQGMTVLWNEQPLAHLQIGCLLLENFLEALGAIAPVARAAGGVFEFAAGEGGDLLQNPIDDAARGGFGGDSEAGEPDVVVVRQHQVRGRGRGEVGEAHREPPAVQLPAASPGALPRARFHCDVHFASH